MFDIGLNGLPLGLRFEDFQIPVQGFRGDLREPRFTGLGAIATPPPVSPKLPIKRPSFNGFGIPDYIKLSPPSAVIAPAPVPEAITPSAPVVAAPIVPPLSGLPIAAPVIVEQTLSQSRNEAPVTDYTPSRAVTAVPTQRVVNRSEPSAVTTLVAPGSGSVAAGLLSRTSVDPVLIGLAGVAALVIILKG